MKGCDHQNVYSGRTSLGGREFEYICSRCGEMGWSKYYVLVQVNHEEFYRLRVIHGWASPPRPPKLPQLQQKRRPNIARDFLLGIALFAFLFALCALSMIPWGNLGPLMPRWVSLVGMGLALISGTLCYLGWRLEAEHG